MNSFAVGLKTRNNLYMLDDSDGIKKIEKVNGKTLNYAIELHVNIWKMPRYMTSWNQATYIDIGIKASFVYNRIKLFLPFTIDPKEGCTDLIEKIKDEKVLNALFNSDCILTSDKDSCFSKVMQYDRRIDADGNHSKTFYLYPLAESNVEIKFDRPKNNNKRNHEGTWLNLSVVGFPSELDKELDLSKEKILEIEDYKNNFFNKENYKECIDTGVIKDKFFYIRFRIQIKKSGEFIIERNLSNDFLQSAFSKIELYDLRFNEARNIHDKINEQFKEEEYMLARFHDAHIFFVSSSKVQVNNGSKIKTDSRIIEPDIWSEYEPPHNPDNIFIAHHWKMIPQDTYEHKHNKRTNKVALDIFFSAVSPRFRFGTVVLYVFVVVLLGCIGSILATDFTSPSKTTTDLEWYQNLSYKQWIIIFMLSYMILWKLTDLTISLRMWWKER